MKIKLECTVSIEREIDLLDEDTMQSMIEELHDSPVGQYLDTQKFVIDKWDEE